MVAVKGDVYDAFEIMDSKLDKLGEKFKEYEDFEKRIDRTVEEKVFEIKAVAYMILIIVAVQLALVIGAVVKLVLG